MQYQNPKRDRFMRVLIYGAGSVGLGIGSCLIASGADVTFLVKKAAESILLKEGLFRDGIFGSYHALPGSFHVITSLDDPSIEHFEYILVCVKSFDTRTASADLSSHKTIFNDTSKIVLFQNGWGNAEIMAERFPKEIVYSARVITGFIRNTFNRVRITVHADSIHIGSLFSTTVCEEIAPLCESISKGGIGCINVKDIGKDLWAKMLYNCALNPLGAIFSVPYGELASYNESREIMDTIIRETYHVMKEKGYSTFWKSPEEYCKVFYGELVPRTAAHESSMLQDIRASKRTEIDALNGEVVRLSSNPGLFTPVNYAIANMIAFISRQNRKQC
jgi:2-dehydropantoate 2-reductase